MKIAFISHEYPPDTSLGGIATYVYQASRLLQSRGHQVEIFSSSPYRQGTVYEDGLAVHRISGVTMENFGAKIAPVFVERHNTVHFDVVEAPEIEAPARGIIELVPDIPLVIKLHTPKFLVDELERKGLHPITKVRHTLNLTRRGKNPVKFWYYNPKLDIERLNTLEADQVVILTQGMADKVVGLWGLNAQKISYVPNPYIPAQALLDIPSDTHTQVVTFLGRLESRKGVVDLARAIPLILRQYPQTRFRFVGKSRIAPNLKMSMQQYLEKILNSHRSSVEFIDGVSLEDIPEVLSKTDICVFPSLWENFPNVCLEAMAAARGIVGSLAGGMVEMLDYGNAGRLVPPQQPKKIADAVMELLENPELRIQLGQNARRRLLTEYGAERVGKQLEDSYAQAIMRRRAEGSRKQFSTALVTTL